MEKKQLLRNLFVMAVADGSIAESEMQLLADRCIQWGVSDDEFAEMISHATSGNAELQLPAGQDAREQLLRELVPMMAADGRLQEHEKHLFAAAAAIMEITPERLDQLIDQALHEHGPG